MGESLVPLAAKLLRRLASVSLVLGLVASGLVATPAGGQQAKRQVIQKKPPYKMGPTGGDEFNEIQADPDSGRISIVRLYPEPGPVGCPDSHAAWANFKVVQKLKKRRIRHITARYGDFEADGYTWLTITVRQRGESIGYRSLQGPAAAQGGVLRAKLWKWPRKGKLTVLFGLQVSSNCPQGEASSVSIPQVNFRLGRLRKR
ncbi:MAG TPA: hypothetical protein VE174_03540 [Actinomycetota bacterium]|nr:hypothetical protein [Actinomycetota bacterium]